MKNISPWAWVIIIGCFLFATKDMSPEDRWFILIFIFLIHINDKLTRIDERLRENEEKQNIILKNTAETTEEHIDRILGKK